MQKQRNQPDLKFPGETFLNMDDPDLNFERAREAALERAHKYDSDR